MDEEAIQQAMKDRYGGHAGIDDGLHRLII